MVAALLSARVPVVRLGVAYTKPTAVATRAAVATARCVDLVNTGLRLPQRRGAVAAQIGIRKVVLIVGRVALEAVHFFSQFRRIWASVVSSLLTVLAEDSI